MSSLCSDVNQKGYQKIWGYYGVGVLKYTPRMVAATDLFTNVPKPPSPGSYAKGSCKELKMNAWLWLKNYSTKKGTTFSFHHRFFQVSCFELKMWLHCYLYVALDVSSRLAQDTQTLELDELDSDLRAVLPDA